MSISSTGAATASRRKEGRKASFLFSFPLSCPKGKEGYDKMHQQISEVVRIKEGLWGGGVNGAGNSSLFGSNLRAQLR